MQPLGKMLQQARAAKGVTLDEAARMTKIRPARLEEIENEDFSQFPSLAYAKGFLQIYGKFLEVDVTPYLDAFETSKHVTVDGYSYLQDNPGPAPVRPVIRRETSKRAPLLPLIIGAVILVGGFFVMKLILDLQRIAPPHERRAQAGDASPAATMAATASPVGNIVAPRAIPVNPADASVAAAPPSAAGTPAAVVAATPIPAPAPSASAEPEVRRAEPVHPEDLARLGGNTGATSPAPASTIYRVVIRPLKKTFVKVTVDNYDAKPALNRWISPDDGPVQFRGQHISVKVLDRDAVEIRKNGKPLADDDADVTIEE
jgi:cytoskeletal protein RodZ